MAAETAQLTDAPPPPEAALEVRLDAPLPAAIAVGRGTAVFVAGTCFAHDARIEELVLLVDGAEQPVMAHGMPRLDLLRATEEASSYRGGFWGMARIAPRRGEVAIGLRARLDDGRTRSAALGSIPVAELPDPLPGAPLVAICMATFEPPPELFRRQIASIRDQTLADWICVISDDCSDPARVAAMEETIAGDDRFVLSRSDRRRGFYANFERALALAPAGARYVAMADQDDDWDPDKLQTLVAAIGDAELVYSDQRIIAEDGSRLADTYWGTRDNNHASLLSLLVANAVTGAASLFSRSLLDDVLPFPPAQFAHFHDHWIALTALSRGDIAYVDRPLYDYVQHGAATLGHANANRMASLRDRLTSLRRGPRERVRLWRMHYFVDVCRLIQFATVLQMRCGDRMTGRKRRSLDRFAAADRATPPVVRLAVRGALELTRRRPQTLGAEWMLAQALWWRRALAASARDAPQRGLRLDAVPPPVLDPRPGARAPGDPELRVMAEKIAPLRLAVSEHAPRRVNVLIPTIDLQHFFGGYIAKLNLARRLAERGLRVRVVTVDPVGSLPRDWKRQVESYGGLRGVFDAVEVAFGRESPGLEVSRDDAWIASTWWTAHIAHRATEARFLYLIQEFEPFTFPMGSYAALAGESYTFPHHALFSSELLREYFRRHRLGVFASTGGESAAFENAITPVTPAPDLAGRRPRRLLFYARPEPHAARNMYELGVLALGRALERGAFMGWELHGIGTVRSGRRIDLGAGTYLSLLPRAAQHDYASVLRAHDVGLALMYTPHPSLVPIEMASAGMLTVTNAFENKTADAMAAISPNIVAADPGVESIATALCAAAAGVEDAERRVHGSRVAWSRDWDESFPDGLLDRVIGFLGA